MTAFVANRGMRAPLHSLPAWKIGVQDGTNSLRSGAMPVALNIDAERRLTITACHGVVTDAEFVRAREQLLADPAFDPSYDRIWDFSAVTEAHVSEAVIAQLVAASPSSREPICRAVVVSERAAPMKTTLDFINHTRRVNRRIAAFPDLASAEKWVFAARRDLPPE